MRADLKEMFEQLTAAGGFTSEAGFRVRALDEGFAALEVAPKAELLQFTKVVHAGVVTGLADHAAGAAYTSTLGEGRICVTIELKINFMKPAKGDLLVAEATVLSAGKSVGVVRADVYAETGAERAHAATALVTLKAISF